jgi:hypothetical protein
MIYKQDYFGFVYIWRDKATKRNYIGSHYGSMTDGYVCSNKWMKAAYVKRPEDFRRRVLWLLTEPDKKLLQQVEQMWLDLIPDEELSTSSSVRAGTNRYYNMKKHASGGNGDANKGQKRGASWARGITYEMRELRRAGLFCLMCDRPKPKPERKPRQQKNRVKRSVRKTVTASKKVYPTTLIQRKQCEVCTVDFWAKKSKHRGTYDRFCSRSCRCKANGAKTDSAANGRRGAERLKEVATGRKRVYQADGTWKWGRCDFSVSTQVASA